jgi:hypothetical protein
LPVGDETPTIRSVAPNVFLPGTTTAGVMITGLRLGTVCPAIAVAPASPLSTFTITSACTDTSITGTLRLDPAIPSGSATLSVMAEGYGGDGFAPQSPGEPQNGSGAVNIASVTVTQFQFTNSAPYYRDCFTASPPQITQPTWPAPTAPSCPATTAGDAAVYRELHSHGKLLESAVFCFG